MRGCTGLDAKVIPRSSRNPRDTPVRAGAYVPAKSHENFLEVDNNPEWLGVARLRKQWRS